MATTALALAGGGCASAHARTGESAEGTAADLRKVERQRLRALLTHDYDTAVKLHAVDFELIDPVGETLSKEDEKRHGQWQIVWSQTTAAA